jgi:diguanylate cyclase (GGDEF)-like protein
MAKRLLKQMRIFTFGITLLLCCSYLSQDTYANERNEIKNVLIINSYNQGFTWSREETDGIIHTLLESDSNISTMVEYMDWKNYYSQENMEYFYHYFKFKYQRKKIDIVITTDDAALEFALANREEMFANVPVVFCGVNQDGVESITKGYDKVTGVIEEIDPTQTINIALNINPTLKNVYILYDNSESGISTGKIVMDKIAASFPGLKIHPWNDIAYEDLIKQVQGLKDDSIILITTYNSDVNQKIVQIDFVNKDISANSSVPVYHLYDFGLNSGILGGSMLSGQLQGENAAALAVRILNGESIENIPVITPKSTRTAFDYQQLERFDIALKEIPKNSEIINKPFSFYETYKILVLSVIAAFIVLLTFVSILLFYIKKIRRMKKNILDSHEELTQIYEELAASDEEMRQQYDEILKVNEMNRLGEEKLTFLAYYDSLTGLKNKLSLYENSKHVFTPHQGKVALLFIDIDNFKYVNDTMGHAFGDQLIVKVSERFTSLLRSNHSIYRLSGDEFIMIMQDVQERKDAENLASYLQAQFSQEFIIQNIILHISLSIGIVLYPEHGNDLEQLLKYADIAMYRAKDAGRKKYVIYDQIMNEVFTERVNIEKYLHKALENNEFEVYYQPQLDLKTNKITGFEALLRWKSPELGSVSPMKFIKVAEDTHFIIPLGTWVLKKACAFLKKLNEKGYEDLAVSVNISILQLLQTDFNSIVDETLQEMQLKPECLELEITESILMESFDSIGSRLEKLSKKNIKIALDDFGKGYSSLNYLKQLPITTLKVDKCFIDSITDKEEDSLTGHIVTIGKSMGMCVVAEGVEVQEQLEYLIQHNCDKMQGYLFSKPVPEEDLIKLLEINLGCIAL